MNRIFTILLAVFYVAITNAQITDVIKNVKPIDTTNVETSNDTTKVVRNIETLEIDTTKAPTLIHINKSLLDSLLKPFYTISIDTIGKDTISNKIIFTPRFRMVVNSNTQDTTYVPIPKTKDHIAVLKTFGIDTLEISNTIELVTIDRTKWAKDPVWWENKNSIGLDINEVAFLNWNAGGSNSVSGLLKIYFARTYEKIYTIWDNEISARYGLNEQQDKGLIKTDDEIKINSTFGYRKDTISKWYYSIKFNFRTQFTDGYKYPNTDDPISRFFAPAYLYFGAGTEYNLKSKVFSVYLSPVTFKSTFVFDETLSNEGAFGVVPGEKSRLELGTLVTGKWDTEIFKNVAMSNRLGLYTDYLNDFGNIDVDWVLGFKFHINKLLEANFRTHLIYDNDIKVKEDTNGDGELETLGARVQLKQQIGIGIIYNF